MYSLFPIPSHYITTDVKPFWEVIIDGISFIASFFKSVYDIIVLIIEFVGQIFEFGVSLVDTISRLPVSLTIPMGIILLLTIIVVILNIIKKIPLL